MERTTSPKRSSRPSTPADLAARLAAAWIGASLLILGGCAPAPTRVSLDLLSVQTSQGAASSKRVPQKSGPLAPLPLPDGALPALSAQGLDDTRAAGLLDEAREQLRANRARAVQRLTDTLTRAYLAEAAADARIRSDRSRADDLARWESTLGSIRRLFEEHADERGDILIELSARVGFPDTGRQATARIPGDPLLPYRQERIDTLRARLKENDADFDRRSLTLLEEYWAERARAEGQLEADARQAQEAALARAVAEARSVIDSTVVAEVEEPSSLRAALPPLSQVEAGRSGPPGRRPQISAPQAPPPLQSNYSRQDIEKLAKVYVAARGWRLATPGSGVRDVTQDFEQWLRNLEFGR